MRYLTRNGSNRYQNGSSNLLTPYREQPRRTRIVVSSPRPLLSAAKRTHHAPIRFNQQAHNSHGHMPYRNKENGNIDVYGGGSLELVRLAHEPASSLPKPCASLKTPHESCPLAAPCWPSWGKNRPWSEISFSLRHLPVRAFDFRAQSFSTILVYQRSSCSPRSPNLVRTQPKDRAFRDRVPCLLRTTTSRRAPN